MRIIDLTVLNQLVALVVVYYMCLYALLLVKRFVTNPPRDDSYQPMVFIVVPAHNEEAVIAHTIESLLNQDYGHLVVMVMNDGSKDRTSEIAHRYADENQRVHVVDRGADVAGRGKGAVLNHAFKLICEMVDRNDPLLEGRSADDILVCITDADGQLERQTLKVVSPYFANPKVGGLQIGVRIANSSTNILTRMQDIEFVGFSAFVQEVRDWFGSVGLGGNGQFTRLSALRSLGHDPWTDCLTEDLDLGLTLVTGGWRIRFCPDAYVAQQAVTQLRPLFKQRTRWIQGHYQCWTHLPKIAQDARIPLPTRLDLSLYLLLVVFVVLVSVGTVCSLVGFTGLFTVRSTMLAGIPGYSARNIVGLLLSFGPLYVFLMTYQSRSPQPLPARWVPAYAVLFAFYTYAWIVATGWAWSRIVLKQGSWAKTGRVESKAAV